MAFLDLIEKYRQRCIPVSDADVISSCIKIKRMPLFRTRVASSDEDERFRPAKFRSSNCFYYRIRFRCEIRRKNKCVGWMIRNPFAVTYKVPGKENGFTVANRFQILWTDLSTPIGW